MHVSNRLSNYKNYIRVSEVTIWEPRTRLARGFSENSQRGIGENVGDATALEYVMEGNFVERYGMKMSGSSQKIKLLTVVVF